MIPSCSIARWVRRPTSSLVLFGSSRPTDPCCGVWRPALLRSVWCISTLLRRPLLADGHPHGHCRGVMIVHDAALFAIVVAFGVLGSAAGFRSCCCSSCRPAWGAHALACDGIGVSCCFGARRGPSLTLSRSGVLLSGLDSRSARSGVRPRVRLLSPSSRVTALRQSFSAGARGLCRCRSDRRAELPRGRVPRARPFALAISRRSLIVRGVSPALQ